MRLCQLFSSADGMTWEPFGSTGQLYDRASFFRDPFRERWVFSARENLCSGGHEHMRVLRSETKVVWESGWEFLGSDLPGTQCLRVPSPPLGLVPYKVGMDVPKIPIDPVSAVPQNASEFDVPTKQDTGTLSPNRA